MVSSVAIIREHCGHVAICSSAIEAPPDGEGGRISQRHMGRTPACVNPDALVAGNGENSTKRSLQDRLLRQCYYSARPGRPLTNGERGVACRWIAPSVLSRSR